MKITRANKPNVEFVKQHEVGEVYVESRGEFHWLVALNNNHDSGRYQMVCLEDGDSIMEYDSLEELDNNNQHDILVDCELVIREG